MIVYITKLPLLFYLLIHLSSNVMYIIFTDTDTIVLIETTEGNLTPSLQQGSAFPALIQPGTHSTTSAIESNVSRANLILVQEKMKLEQQVEQLHKEMGEMEHRYKIEIQRLKSRVSKAHFLIRQNDPN